MKIKIFSVLFIMAIALTGCFVDDDDDSSGSNTATTTTNPGKVTVTVKYTGSVDLSQYPIDTAEDGEASGKIFVYLYSTLDDGYRSNVEYKGSTDNVISADKDYEITISDVKAGDYYVMAFFDKDEGSNSDNKLDEYSLYDADDAANYLAANADSITVTTDKTTAISMTVDGNGSLAGSGQFATSK